MSRVTGKLLWVSILLASLPVFVRGKQQQPDQPIKLTAELIVVDAQVVNQKTGRVVGALNKDDFIIHEDGLRQTITHFSQDRLPLSIVLLLDVSGSVRPILEQIRDGALMALERLKPEDEVALVVFATRTKVLQDFTRDRKLIADRIDRIRDERGVGGGTLLDEGVYQAAQLSLRASSPAGRRVIIAVTDNIASKAVRGHSTGEAHDAVLESGSVVCGLIVGSWVSKMTGGIRTLFIWNKWLLGTSVNKYAESTGGVVLKSEREEVAGRLAELIDQVRSRYSLGYTPSNTVRDGKFRKIKVAVTGEVTKREGELVVLSRRGYYSARDASAAKARK